MPHRHAAPARLWVFARLSGFLLNLPNVTQIGRKFRAHGLTSARIRSLREAICSFQIPRTPFKLQIGSVPGHRGEGEHPVNNNAGLDEAVFWQRNACVRQKFGKVLPTASAQRQVGKSQHMIHRRTI
jgi:hypothetical protein